MLNDKLCFSFDGSNFKSIETSKYSHYRAQLGNYRGQPFTTGCNGSQDCWVKTEIFDIVEMKWSVAADYPTSL